MTTASIVVSVNNKAHYIDDFLWILRSLNPSLDELVVVNDGSTDDTGPISKKWCDVYIETNDIWETLANNTGLKASSGDYVAIVQDDDLVVAYDWLSDCIEMMEKYGIAILGGRGFGHHYLCSDSTVIHSDEKVFLDKGGWAKQTYENARDPQFIRSTIHIDAHDPKHHEQVNKAILDRDLDCLRSIGWLPRPVLTADIAIRSPLIFHRPVAEELKWFDTEFRPLMYDDHDLGLRAIHRSYRSAITLIPQVSKFRGGSKPLYSDESKKKLFADATTKNEKLILKRLNSQYTPKINRNVSLAKIKLEDYTPN